MKESNTKILGVIILLLFIVNITTLSFFWYTTKRHDLGPSNKGGAAAFIIKKLGFDSSQQETYNLLRQEHQQAMHGIKKQIEEGKEAYFSLLSDSMVSELAIVAAASKASTAEQQIDIITFHHFQKVRAICTAEQKKKFDAIINQVTRMMGRPQGPPPHKDGKDDTFRNNHPPDGNDRFPPPPDGNDAPPPRQ